MEDAPSSTFSNLPRMMKKPNLSSGDNSVDGEEDKDEEQRQWREMDGDALEANKDTPAPSISSWIKTAETSDSKPSVDLTKSTMDYNLSYEERAALRRAERARRRKEREALVATAK